MSRITPCALFDITSLVQNIIGKGVSSLVYKPSLDSNYLITNLVLILVMKINKSCIKTKILRQGIKTSILNNKKTINKKLIFLLMNLYLIQTDDGSSKILKTVENFGNVIWKTLSLGDNQTIHKENIGNYMSICYWYLKIWYMT